MTQSEFVRKALKTLFRKSFRAARAELLPKGRAQNIYADEDVFTIVRESPGDTDVLFAAFTVRGFCDELIAETVDPYAIVWSTPLHDELVRALRRHGC